MNYGRLVAAALTGTVVDAVYGFCVYGLLMRSEFSRYPEIYRPADAPAMFLGTMFAGIFVAMLIAVTIYSKGHEGRGPGEGMRFGMLLGMFVGILFASISYGTLNIGRKLTAELALAGFIEWTLVGSAVGLVYRPGANAAMHRAAV